MATKQATKPNLEALLKGVKANKSTTLPQFQEICAAYNSRNPDMAQGLSGVMLYVYRTFPKIDNKGSGRAVSYIDKIDCVNTDGAVSQLPADLQDYVTAKFGGGRYSLSLNDKGREPLPGTTKASAQQVALAPVVVDDVAYPPILDVREIVHTDPDTNTWAMRQVSLGVYERNADGSYSLKQTAAQQQQAAQEGTGAGAIARVLDKLVTDQGRGAEKVMDMMSLGYQRLMAEGGGAKQPDFMGPMVTMFTQTMQMMAQQNQATMQMIVALSKPAPPPPAAAAPAGSLAERMEEWKLLSDVMGGKSHGESWADILKSAAPYMMPLLMRLMVPGGVPGAPPAAAVPAAPPPAAPPPGNNDDEFARLVQRFMEQGKDGSDFATAIDGMRGPEVYDQIRANGKDNLIGALLRTASAPYFSANGAAVAKFMDEFIEWGAETETPAGAAA